MSAASFSQDQNTGFRHYLADVSNAARAFFAALFAAQQRQFVAQEVDVLTEPSPRARAKSRRELFAMADRYQNIAPSLSDEFRNLASRG